MTIDYIIEEENGTEQAWWIILYKNNSFTNEMGLFAVSDPAQKCQKYGSFNLHPITRRKYANAVWAMRYADIILLLYYMNYNYVVYYFG